MNITTVPESSAAGQLEALFRGLDASRSPREILGDLVRAVHTVVSPRANIRLATSGLPQGSYRITRLHTPDGPAPIEEADWDADLSSFPVHAGGIAAELVREPGIKMLVEPDFSDDPALSFLGRNYRSGVAMPLYSAAHPGNWLIVLSHLDDLTEASEVADLALRTHLIGMALDNLHLRRALAKENARKDWHLASLSAVQETLVPKVTQLPHGYEVALSHVPYFHAGGDLALCLPLPSDDSGTEWVFIIADTTGHGPECTVMMGLVYALLRQALEKARGPAELFSEVNRTVCSWELAELRMLPVFAVFLHTGTSRVRYASAGHPAAVLVPADRAQPATPLDESKGPPLALVPNASFQEGVVDMVPGDLLLMYTDGVSEMRKGDNEVWGDEAVWEAARAAPAEPAACIEHVMKMAIAFAASSAVKDDCTLAAVRRTL